MNTYREIVAVDIEESRLKVAEDVTFQSMGPGEQTVVLSLTSGQLYTCNETTESFLKALDGRRTFGEVVQLLVEQYEVADDRLRSDLQTMAEELLAEKLITQVKLG